MQRHRWLLVCLVVLFAHPTLAADPPKAAEPEPTIADVAYGPEDRQKLDVYLVDSDKPTPLVFMIHGGGWNAGDKRLAGAMTKMYIQKYLDAGISVVSINYRLVPAAKAAGIEPPVSWPLHDAARALQFTRAHAKEWNFDPERIGATGGSAGACTTLWLALHDDLADPNSDDPIARESTRLKCAGPMGAQTCLDPKLMLEWMPQLTYGAHAYGMITLQEAQTKRDQIEPWIKEYSPYGLADKNDPPLFLEFSQPMVENPDRKAAVHSPIFGTKLAEHVKEVGGQAEVIYPGGPDGHYKDTAEFMIDQLKN